MITVSTKLIMRNLNRKHTAWATRQIKSINTYNQRATFYHEHSDVIILCITYAIITAVVVFGFA